MASLAEIRAKLKEQETRSTGGSTSGSTVPMNTTVIEPIQPKPITPSVQPRTSVNIDTLDFMTGTPTF